MSIFLYTILFLLETKYFSFMLTALIVLGCLKSVYTLFIRR